MRGKIFATVPPGGEHLQVFVGDDDREIALELAPGFLEKLHWGQRVVGVRVTLAKARPAVVTRLLAQAWTRKAPRALLSRVAP